MEEKILIQSKQYNVKKLFLSFVIIGAIITALCMLFIFVDEMPDRASWYNEQYEQYSQHQEDGYCFWSSETEKCSDCKDFEEYPPKLIYMITKTIDYNDFELSLCWIPLLALTLIGVLIYLWLYSYQLTVTDKRIYGKVAGGKRVDLPIDSISATATITLFKGVSVSTSSGRISFLVIKNAEEIYKTISDLLIERQQAKTTKIAEINPSKSDEVEQIKKFKELLDSGVITQEEFDEKKKQLLGL